MTNEEKAMEIALSNDIYDTTEVYQSDVVDMLMQMAKWKDEQLAEQKQQIIDKACDAYCKDCEYIGCDKFECYALEKFIKAMDE